MPIEEGDIAKGQKCVIIIVLMGVDQAFFFNDYAATKATGVAGKLSFEFEILSFEILDLSFNILDLSFEILDLSFEILSHSFDILHSIYLIQTVILALFSFL